MHNKKWWCCIDGPEMHAEQVFTINFIQECRMIKFSAETWKDFINPYPWIFGAVKERVYLKKSPKSKLVTSVVNKIICADRVTVGLSYDAYFKWHIPIWGEICRAEQKYMPVLGPSSRAIPEKKSKAHKHIIIYKWCKVGNFKLCSGFFPENALSDGPAFWIFFQDSRIRVKDCD